MLNVELSNTANTKIRILEVEVSKTLKNLGNWQGAHLDFCMCGFVGLDADVLGDDEGVFGDAVYEEDVAADGAVSPDEVSPPRIVAPR